MTQTLLVSTRKGLFVLEREREAWRVARHAFLGDNLALALADHRDGTWYAALDLGHFGAKLQASHDQGRSWHERAVPAYAEDDVIFVGDGKEPKPATLQKLWALEAGGANQPGRLWCGTIPGGLFRSDDGGASWQMQRALWDRPERREWFGGGYDAPGIHSLCVDPRDPRRIVLALSSGGVWRSDDDGASWAQSAHGMRAAYMPPDRAHDPNIQDVHHMVQCAGAPQRFWVQHHNGVFVSDDGARHWREIDEVQPSAFGFAVAVHPHDPETAWFVPAIKDERRVPVDGALVVARTRDGGRSFEVLRDGLPQRDAYDLVYRHALAIDRDGTQLAFGSTTGGLWTSADQGQRWQLVDARLPPIHAVTFG